MKKSSSFIDPLSSLGPLATSFEGSDPLSKLASEGVDQVPRGSRTKVWIHKYTTVPAILLISVACTNIITTVTMMWNRNSNCNESYSLINFSPKMVWMRHLNHGQPKRLAFSPNTQHLKNCPSQQVFCPLRIRRKVSTCTAVSKIPLSTCNSE